MTTDYYLFCKDCNDRLIIDDVHSPEGLTSLWDHRTELAAALSALPFLSRIDVEHSDKAGGYVSFNYFGGQFIKWCSEHKDHNVVVRDEYGGYVKECNHLVQCPHCQTKVPCKLDVGHEGAHTAEAWRRGPGNPGFRL